MKFIAITPSFVRKHFWRVLFTWLLSAITILVLARISYGTISQAEFIRIIIFAGVLGLLNALLRPIILYFTLPFTMLTFGLFSLVVDGLIVWIAANAIFQEVSVTLLEAIIFSLILALINMVLSGILSIKDEDSYYYSVVRNLAKKYGGAIKTDKPGYLFLEIDGLAKEILEKALDLGMMPHLSNMLATTHELTGWETDYSCQTCASQSGLLLGNNKDVVAFRWFDRKTGNYFTASSMPMVSKLEKQLSHNDGLLQHNGISISNMMSGNAKRAIITTSRLNDPASPNPLYYFFINPYNYARSVILTVVDLVKEVRDNRRQKQINPPWMVHRGMEFAFSRAFTNVLAADMAIQSVFGEVLAGTPSIYMTYFAYDENSHFTGLTTSESLSTLKNYDEYLGKLVKVLAEAPRPYHVIVLSDHGQTQGPNFVKEYGYEVSEVVKKGLPKTEEVKMVVGLSEGSIVFNSMMNEIKSGISHKLGWDKNKKKGELDETSKRLQVNVEEVDHKRTKGEFGANGEVLVLGSGNAGLVYFSAEKTRQRYEDLNSKYPKLFDTLTKHPGIGFVMVDSKKHGPIALGRQGQIVLKTGRVTGKNPLLDYGKNAAHHLLRTSSFSTCPDILINGAYNPKIKFGHGFEPQAAFHGGLGGTQSYPFLLYPKSLGTVKTELLGAEAVHRQFMKWMKEDDAKVSAKKKKPSKGKKKLQSKPKPKR